MSHIASKSRTLIVLFRDTLLMMQKSDEFLLEMGLQNFFGTSFQDFKVIFTYQFEDCPLYMPSYESI